MSFRADLGLSIGDAHFIRNGGGIVTDDVIRSLVLSNDLLGTTSVMIINHTDCGLNRMSDEELNKKFQKEFAARLPSRSTPSPIREKTCTRR